MKNKLTPAMHLLVYIALSAWIRPSYSQDVNDDISIRCGTMHHYAWQVAQDPSIETRRAEFEEKVQEWIAANGGSAPDVNVTIPVVVHIVYHTDAQNVTDQTVYEQVEVLNTDYGGLNPHPMWSFSNTLKANTDVQFCLAKRKPDGTPTNGIERRYTDATSFTDDDLVKFYSSGGMDAWDPTKYMNIWVCNLTPWLGYAQYPWAGINSTYGLVVKYSAWGLTGAVAPYNLGGTGTHELGHCFTLYHIWVNDGCGGSDQCGDTPNQDEATYGHHTGLLTDACSPSSPGIMYMNFMDYSDDQDYANFTPDQKTRIQSCFASGGYLYSMLTSNGCSPVTTTLYSDAVQTATTDPDWFLFNNNNGYWCAVGIRPDYAGEDWDVHMYSDDGFTPPTIASSSYGSGTPVDFVVMDNNHSPMKSRGIKADRWSGTHNATIEFEGYSETLSFGSNTNIDWPAGDVVEMWDVNLQPGTYKFKLTFNSGAADLGMALFGSNSAAYYAGRSDNMAIADANGSGLGEEFTVTVTTADWYGFCVFSNNANAANFNILIGIPGQWLGTISSNWNTAGNWGLGEIPTSTTDVTINSGTPYAPVIGNTVNAYCHNLTLLGGATLTQQATSYFYVYGDFNTDAGQFTMTGTSYLYFKGSEDNSWDDDNTNDTYTYVRVDKSIPTAYTMLWQDFAVSGPFEVREGVLRIDGTWTLTVNSTSSAAFVVENGGKLQLADEHLDVAGGIRFEDGSQADVAGGTIYCGGNFRVEANTTYNIVFTGGTLTMDGGGAQYMQDLDGGTLRLYNLTIAKSAGTTCFIANANLHVTGNLLISSGVLSANNAVTPTTTYNIYVSSDWTNNVGAGGFVESTGTVIFNGGNYHQYCSTETFNILEVNKTAGGAFRLNGGNVTCASYNWTAGAIDVLSGHFTANALADNGIAGSFYLNAGGQVDLTNTAGYVDLNGFLYIYGGTFNVHGGTSMSYWPYSSNAGITMSGGILDFKDQGIRINNTSYTLSVNITGGIIRTPGSIAGYRSDFQPAGGTFEMYGPAQATITTVNGHDFHHLNINKAATYPLDGQAPNPYLDRLKPEGDETEPMPAGLTDNTLVNNVIASSNLDINGNFTLTSGTFTAPDTLYVGLNWTNLAGEAAFIEGTGAVWFNGALAADITTNETFANLFLTKTYADFDGLEFASTVSVSNMLFIIDGTLEINPGGILDVGGNIIIQANAGLNANDNNVTIYCGGSWSDDNTTHSTTVGFTAGTASVVHFDAAVTTGIQIIKEDAPFNNIIINSGSPWVRPDLTHRVVTCNTMTISSGKLRLAGGKVNILVNLDIYGTIEMDQAADSIVVEGDIFWRSGSNDNITNGKILAGSDWTFFSGTNAILGNGNTVIFNQILASLIRCDDDNAAFGTLVLGKPAGNSSDTYIHASSLHPMRVNGSMTIDPGNQFHMQGEELIVNGNLGIQPTAECYLNGGTLTNHHTSFDLAGLLDVGTGTALVHGTLEFLSTSKIVITGGSFTSDAPEETGFWQYFRGIFKITNGVFENTHNSINFTSTAIDSISGGTIISGYAFSAQYAGTFQPTGGKVKLQYPSVGIVNIFCSGGNYFHDLETAGQYKLSTDIQINNDLLISALFLSTDTYDIFIGGDWTNNVGTNGFLELSNRVVFNGSDHQYCYGETFNELEIDKSFGDLIIPTGAAVTCAAYDWTDGELEVAGGSFIADDLVDNGLYGSFYINSSGGLMELHQDASQYIDLNGRVVISAGEMHIYGGNGPSYWPYAGNADLWLYGGVLDFKDNGVWVNASAYTLNENITGGLIRVNQSFTGNRTDFNPAGGTLELYGGTNTSLGHGPGSSFHHVVINKTNPAVISPVSSPLQINGNFTFEEGSMTLNTDDVNVGGDVIIQDGGYLQLVNTSELVMTNGNSIEVNSGGLLGLDGEATGKPVIRSENPASYYHFNINAGGSISAEFADFRNMGMNGVNVHSGATVYPAHAFLFCTFEDGVAGGTLLTINNDQDLAVDGAVFPSNTWGSSSNVTKTLNQGEVNFINYLGGFSGEPYDNDAYNRINWYVPMTLAVSASPPEICPGGSSQLLAMVSGGQAPYTYLWSPPESLSDPAIADPVATPAATTTYSVTVMDATFNIAIASVPVTVFPLPMVTCPPGVELCLDNGIFYLETLPVSPPSNGAGSVFTGPGVTPANPGLGWYDFDPLIAGTGTHTITYTYTDANGCSNFCTFTITVNPLPMADAGPDVTIASGSSTVLNGSASGGEPPYTYNWSPVDGLSDPGAQNPEASPAVTTTYTLLVTDNNGCTATAEVTVTVIPAGSGSLEGVLTYDNTAGTPLSQVLIELRQSGSLVQSTLTDITGHYLFSGQTPGTYTLRCVSTTPWGGCNSADALLVLKHFAGISTLTGLRLLAANVDNSPLVNSIDALMVARRFTNLISSFPAGDWAFFEPTVTVVAGTTTIQDMKGLCYGDVNGSNVPPYKTEPAVILARVGEMECPPAGEIRIPFHLSEALPVGAVSLVLTLPANHYNFTGVVFGFGPVDPVYNISGNTLRIAWYSADDQTITPDDVLCWLIFSSPPDEDFRFTALAESELSDHDGKTLADVVLTYPKLVPASGTISWSASLQPNPFKGYTTLSFSTMKPVMLTYRLTDFTGRTIRLVDEGLKEPGNYRLLLDGTGLAAGSYLLRLEVNDQGVVDLRRYKLSVVR